MKIDPNNKDVQRYQATIREKQDFSSQMIGGLDGGDTILVLDHNPLTRHLDRSIQICWTDSQLAIRAGHISNELVVNP
jgi:hypothetical protein